MEKVKRFPAVRSEATVPGENTFQALDPLLEMSSALGIRCHIGGCVSERLWNDVLGELKVQQSFLDLVR
jgi:hypothetical protein